MSWGDCHCHMILKVLRLWFNCKLWCWLIANFDVIIVISCFDVITCLIASFDVAKFCDISCWEMNFPLEYAHDMPTCRHALLDRAKRPVRSNSPENGGGLVKGILFQNALNTSSRFFWDLPEISGTLPHNVSVVGFGCSRVFCSTRTSWARTVPVASKGP